ncbi:MAG: hypothetical protein JKY56_23330 [Kofleriaceae bacterium]|nr:hypothetical protein [Kofleriaceae bacterium]
MRAQLERVLSDFDNDDELLVYADMLTQWGNPLGKFIALQMLAEPTKQQLGNALQFAQKHRSALAGALDEFVARKDRGYARGFLTRCRLKRSASLADLVAVSGSRSLLELDLSHNRTVKLRLLRTLKQLNVLYLDYTTITSLENLARLTALTHLDLRGCKTSNLAPLAGLPKLSYLGLAETNVRDLRPLANLSGIEHLDLANTRVIDLAPLTGLTKLVGLDLRGTQVDISQFEMLQKSLNGQVSVRH